MTMSVATRRQVDQILVRARQRFEAAERTAHRNDSQQGEFDNAYEGAVSGINFVVEAFLLASTGTRRKVGEDDAPTLIRSTCAGLSAKRIACPDPMELCWEQTRRNASAHQGDWASTLGPADLERIAGLGSDLLVAVEAYLKST
jgi:hypothetical protein